jgi:hypothetical protein
MRIVSTCGTCGRARARASMSFARISSSCLNDSIELVEGVCLLVCGLNIRYVVIASMLESVADDSSQRSGIPINALKCYGLYDFGRLL